MVYRNTANTYKAKPILPPADLKQSKTAVLHSLGAASSQESYCTIIAPSVPNKGISPLTYEPCENVLDASQWNGCLLDLLPGLFRFSCVVLLPVDRGVVRFITLFGYA